MISIGIKENIYTDDYFSYKGLFLPYIVRFRAISRNNHNEDLDENRIYVNETYYFEWGLDNTGT